MPTKAELKKQVDTLLSQFEALSNVNADLIAQRDQWKGRTLTNLDQIIVEKKRANELDKQFQSALKLVGVLTFALADSGEGLTITQK